MEYFNGVLQPNFNTVYTNIVNCILTNPPYLSGRVPQTFFLEKRGGFSNIQTLGYDEIYDMISTLGVEYYIGRIGTNIVVKKGGTTITTISTTPYVQGINYKFIFGTSAKGTALISGTGMTSNIVSALNQYLEDLTASWVVNAYAGMFVYITGGTSGSGQMVKVISNTATQMQFQSIEGTITGGTYSVYPDLGSILFFLGGDGLYGIHDGINAIKCPNFVNIKDIAYLDQRFFSFNSNGNINHGGQGQNVLYQDGTSLGTTAEGIVAIASFQDYLLIMGSTKISLIRKETVSLSGTTIDTFPLIDVTSDFGIFSPKSYSIYNEGLYVFTSDRKFISISIRSITISKFIIVLNDEGIYVQKDFDNITLGTNVNIYIDSNEIKLINTYTGNTDFFIYDRYYKGWHKWNSSLQINGYYNVGKKFFGPEVYTIDNNKKQDSGVLAITQKIKLILGAENFTNFKNVKFQKLILGSGSSTGIINNYSITSGENLITFSKQIKGAKLLYQGIIANAAKGGILGQSILGLGVVGQNDKTLKSLYPQIGNVNIKLGFACELLESELVAGDNKNISFGGQLIGYELPDPGVTSVKNVI